VATELVPVDVHRSEVVVATPPSALPVAPQRLRGLDDLRAGFLASKRSANTRSAYRLDLDAWFSWCEDVGVDPLAAGIHHADVYLRLLAEQGDPATGRILASSSIRRRTSAIHGFYTYATRQEAVVGSPFTGASRPPAEDESMTSGLSRDEVRALLATARDHSPRSGALMTLLVLNGLRISEALNARITDLDFDRGHRVLRITRKGNKRAKVPLTPAAQRCLEEAIGDRTAGPIFVTRTGKALDRTAAWRLLRKLAANAELPGAFGLSPHSMRHTYATVALDAGVGLRDVQDSMGHRDPRTTRMYDRSRNNLDRNATYAVASALADS
jgi:integrase/recombinase XerD